MEINQDSELLREIETGYSLPSLSPVAMRLVEVALDDACSAEDLADLIEMDPSLTVRVLKLANSAFFQTRQPTSSLKQAVVKLGFKRLRIMALSLSLRDTFPMGRIGALDYKRFWQSALYRALISKSLASHIKNCYPEEAFVAGLIMEIGLLILFDLRIKEDKGAPPIKTEPLEKLLEWERERYGIDHRQVGEAALNHWNFPKDIIQCQPLYGQKTHSDDAPVLAKVYELSRGFSRLIFQEKAGFITPFGEAERMLGLDRDTINDILLTTFEQVQGIAESLSVEMNKERDLMEIMEKANNALSRISERMSRYQEKMASGPLPSLDNLEREDKKVDGALQAVAHEIRNPLLAVGGFARRLANSLDPDSRGGEYAKIILEESSRLEKALSEMALSHKSKKT